MSQVTIKLGTTIVVNIAGVENEYLVTTAGEMPILPHTEILHFRSKKLNPPKGFTERFEIYVRKKITIEEQ